MQRRHEPNACVWKRETNASSTSANDMASSTQKRRSLGSFMMDDPSCFFNISTNTFTTSSLLVPAFPNVSSSNVDGDVCVVEEEMLSMRMVLAARPIAASFVLSPTVWSITSFKICGGWTHEKHTLYIAWKLLTTTKLSPNVNANHYFRERVEFDFLVYRN